MVVFVNGMNTMLCNFIIEPSFIVGKIVTNVAFGISFAAFEPNKTEVSAIKKRLSVQNKWPGRTIQS